MTDKELIKAVMRSKHISQKELARRANFKNPANVAGLLNSNKKSMRCDNLVRLLSAMDCEIIVVDIGTDEDWTLDFDNVFE